MSLCTVLNISIHSIIFSHLTRYTEPLASSSSGRVHSKGVVGVCFCGQSLVGLSVLEDELQLEGDLAFPFGLGCPAAAALTMTTSLEASYPGFLSTKPLAEFAIDYGRDVVEHDPEEREISLQFDKRGGARWRTNVQFEAGMFSVKIKTPDGDTSGLNTSFYLSSLEGDKLQDEIDFEFLGKDKGSVQTNYYTTGTGNREEIHPLGFDSSSAFHDYTIRWLPGKIEWLIDGRLVRTVVNKDGEAWPKKPMYLYASIWNAGDIDEGRWAGSYSGAHEPYVSKYRDVHVPLNHSGSTVIA